MKHRPRLILAWAMIWGLVAGCLAPSGQGVQEVGDPCVWNIECATEVCIPSFVGDQPTGWSDGMCTQTCPEAGCEAGTTCVVLAEVGYCLPACSWRNAASTCREGYVCAWAVGACLPDCRRGWDCGEPYVCGEDGTCR